MMLMIQRRRLFTNISCEKKRLQDKGLLLPCSKNIPPQFLAKIQGSLHCLCSQTSALEEYRHLYAMSVKHRSAREVPDLYRPEDIDAILKHKAVIIIAKASAKYRLKDVCLHSQARFYVSRGYLILWNSVFVANKDFPPDLFKELNKR
ncbi:hypothetical protein HPB48_016882 [Haemaphysalis longicornis]|uniref:Uncharacterized protein n=1 Tax=Haemaphysalis longicornis TaxID=44386 RepID=A0A9J6GH86_HAELO|nr:hypothetical protein HPB48_016882 [Haemaphysalis longicornis]